MKKPWPGHRHLSAKLVADVLARRLPVAAGFALLLDTIADLCEDCRAEIDQAADENALRAPSLGRLAARKRRAAQDERASAELAAQYLAEQPDAAACRAALAAGLVRPSAALVEALLDSIRQRARSAQRRRTLELTEFTLDLVTRLAAEPEPPRGLLDLSLLARAHHANALRIAGRLEEAQALVQQLLPRLEEALDPLTEAEGSSLAASVEKDAGRFKVALDLASRAGASYALLGDHHEVGRTLLICSDCAYELGALESAIESVYIALEYLDPADPFALFCARFKLALYLETAGRLEEAEAELARLDDAPFSVAGDPKLAAHVDWLAARLATARGHTEHAEARYRRAVEGLADAGNPLDAALAVLEFALFLSVQDRAGEIADLCLVAAARIDSAGLSTKSRDVWEIFLVSAQAGSLARRELLTFVEIVRNLRRQPDADVPRPS